MASPAKVAAWPGVILRAVLSEPEAREVLTDLDELFQLRVDSHGLRAARRWYVRQCLGCAWRLGTARAGANGVAAERGPSRVRWLVDLPRDVRVVGRSLLRRPTYTVAVGLTLGVGMAGLCIVYSVAHWVLLRPVPGVTDPERVVQLLLEVPGGGGPIGGGFPFSHVDAVDLADHTSYLAEFTAATPQEIHFGVGGAADAERISGEVVWPGYFEVLGVRLKVGRTFQADSSGNIAVVSDRLARRYHADVRAAVGTRVFVNGRAFTIVGVAPRDFHGAEIPGVADLWLPSWSLPGVLDAPDILTNRASQVWSTMLARPKENATAQQLQDAFNERVGVLRKTDLWHSFMVPDFNFRSYAGIGVQPALRAGLERTLGLVGMAALLLLLLTGANVANLALSRNAALGPGAAIRRALGASGSRIVRERLIESALLGAAGAIVSTVLTIFALRSLQMMSISRSGVSLEDIRLTGAVLAAGIGAAVLAGILSGLLPALLSSRTVDPVQLRKARHGDKAATQLRAALVITQVAISMVLIVGGGLLVRTLYNLRNVPVGFDQENVVVFSVDPGMQGYDGARMTTFMRTLVEDLQRTAGVRSVAITDHPLISSFTFSATIEREGVARDGRGINTRRVQMSPALLDVLGMPLVAGTPLTADWLVRDSAVEPTAILSETAATTIFPGVPAPAVVGRTIKLSGTERPVRITGIVGDTRLSTFTRQTDAMLFQPWSQGWKTGQFTVYVKAEGGRDIRPDIQRLMHRIDPALPVFGLRSLRQEIDTQLVEQRFVASLATALAGTGILLAMLGLYGTLSYSVMARRRELGIRAALGALPRELVADVVHAGLLLATAGVVIGVCVSVYASQLIAPRLYGVRSFDGATYVAGMMLMFGVALLACLIPGSRAAATDPLEALRCE